MKKIGIFSVLIILGMFLLTMLTASVTASPWSQGGNNIGAATAMGSTDNYDVYFITGNTEAMRIDTNQRIGIADSTPDFRLEVAGTSGNGYFGVTSGTDGDVFIIDSRGDVGIGTTNPDNKLTVSGDADFTGSVGIGTTSPSYKLDVKAWSVVGPITFDGVGLDDMTPGGTYLGSEKLNYAVEIDGTGTPDTFKWSDDGGSTWDGTGVGITGSAQSLNYGVTVTFGETTGHTLGDKWLFETDVTNPFSVQDAAGNQVFSVNNDGIFGINMTPTDSEYVLEVGGDIWFNSSIVKFGNSSLITHSDADKNSYMGTQFVRIIFDADNSANDYYFAVGVHEDKRKNTPAYATSERFWIREDGKTGIGAQSPLGRLWVNTEPVTGTGSIITSSGTTVTGSDTSFTSELKVGDEIWIEISHGSQPYDQQKNIRRVVSITSDISLEVDRPFTIWDKPTREEVQKDITSATSFKYTRPILCVETNERVGISTISPTEKLDVNGKARVRNLDGYEPTDTIVTADLTGVLHDSGKTLGDFEDHDWHEVGTSDPPDDINDNIFTNGKVGIGTANPDKLLHIGVNGGSSGTIRFEASDGDEVDLGITTSDQFYIIGGNVGIGTANPNAPLEVMNTIGIESSLHSNSLSGRLKYTHSGSWQTGKIDIGINSGIGGVGMWDVLTINHQGSVGIGTTDKLSKLTTVGHYLSVWGHVSYTQGTNTLSGSDTHFLSEIGIGDKIIVTTGAAGTYTNRVTAITSDTLLTVETNWGGTFNGQTATVYSSLFRVEDSNNVAKVLISDSGMVGIGTTTPDEKFEVEWGSNVDVEIGKGSTTQTITFITLRSANGNKWWVYPNNAGVLQCVNAKP